MNLKTGVITSSIIAIVIIVVLFNVFASVMDDAQTAGNDMNASNVCSAQGCYWNITTYRCMTDATNVNICAAGSGGLPLSSLFNGTGVIFVIVMAALMILVIMGLMSQMKKK